MADGRFLDFGVLMGKVDGLLEIQGDDGKRAGSPRRGVGQDLGSS